MYYNMQQSPCYKLFNHCLAHKCKDLPFIQMFTAVLHCYVLLWIAIENLCKILLL